MNIRIFLAALVSLPAIALAEPPPPDWIWSAEGDRMDEMSASVERDFSVSGEIERATLRATADYASLTVSLNGKTIIELDAYDPPAEVDVSRLIVSGDNNIVAVAIGCEGPSALAISLEIRRKAAEPIKVATNGEWKRKNGDPVRDLGAVDPRRWGLNQLPEVSPFAEYNQWMEAKPGSNDAKLSPLPPGFEIAKIRDAQPGEDSWVSLTFDPKGRLIIGKEQKGLLRLTLSDNGSEVVSAETIEDTLEECRGLVWKGNDLYAHANKSKALYRLRDTDGDDRFDEVTKLLSTEGGTGHGRNALTVGPDGAIHAITGDDIAVPESSPRRARPEKNAPKELGHWARYTENTDGSATWEAMCRGLRNPYGIDFNEDGEAFTYDADNEGDVGLPFYRPTRINHLVSGANYGWHQDRQNQRSLPVYAPDSVPTTFDVGRGSPTGVRFGTRSDFPLPWREALFALDWAYGRIVAVHLTPNGASYLGSGEVFLEGRPLNVTDLDFDAQGAMWFVTGGRKTQAALYRVRYTGPLVKRPGPGEQTLAGEAYAKQARETRKKLERFHGRVDPTAVDELWPHLASADPWIRNAARVALEWQPVEQWRDRVSKHELVMGRLTALLALARVTGQSPSNSVSNISPKQPENVARSARLTSYRRLELIDQALPPRASLEERPMVFGGETVESLRREDSLSVRHEAETEGIEKVLDYLASAEDQLERLHHLEVLSETNGDWMPEQRVRFFTALSHAKRFSYGDRFMLPFFQTLEKNALSNVEDTAEREKFTKLLAEAPEADSAPAVSRPVVKQWTMADFPEKDAAPSDADHKRGRELFSTVLCARCHVCGSVGRPVGPDLSTVASRFSRRDLLESIIEPSKVVAEVHRNVIVSKTDGGVVQGRIVQNDFRESKLTLSINPFAPSELVTLPKSEIKSWEESPVSPMPPALLDTLTRAEIDDLLAFILSGGR